MCIKEHLWHVELDLHLMLNVAQALFGLYWAVLVHSVALSSVLLAHYWVQQRRSFRSLVYPGFITGEAPHCSGEDAVVHTEVNIINHTLIHGINMVSMRLTEWRSVASKHPCKVSKTKKTKRK